MALNDYYKRINFKSAWFWVVAILAMSAMGLQITESYFNIDFNEGKFELILTFTIEVAE